jgi:hypothetical protein
MRVTNSVASPVSSYMAPMFVVAIQALSGLVPQASAFLKRNIAMVLDTAKTKVIPPIKNVVSKDSRHLLLSAVVVPRDNGSVCPVSALPSRNFAMARLNAKINLTRIKANAALKSSLPMTPKSVAVTPSLSGNVIIMSVSAKRVSVMVNHSALMAQMKEVQDVVTGASSITMRKSAVATQRPNGHVPAVNASKCLRNVTAKSNAKTNLTKLINAASVASSNMVRSNVAVTLSLNLPVIVASVSP